jgi:hypothetical protein
MLSQAQILAIGVTNHLRCSSKKTLVPHRFSPHDLTAFCPNPFPIGHMPACNLYVARYK